MQLRSTTHRLASLLAVLLLLAACGSVAPTAPEPYLAIAPPFPLTGFGEFPGVTGFSKLSDLLKYPWTVAIVLLRLGRYSFGIAEDERLTVHKTGSRYVKNRQRKGGQSASRFVRNREKAIQQLYFSTS